MNASSRCCRLGFVLACCGVLVACRTPRKTASTETPAPLPGESRPPETAGRPAKDPGGREKKNDLVPDRPPAEKSQPVPPNISVISPPLAPPPTIRPATEPPPPTPPKVTLIPVPGGNPISTPVPNIGPKPVTPAPPPAPSVPNTKAPLAENIGIEAGPTGIGKPSPIHPATVPLPLAANPTTIKPAPHDPAIPVLLPSSPGSSPVSVTARDNSLPWPLKIGGQGPTAGAAATPLKLPLGESVPATTRPAGTESSVLEKILLGNRLPGPTQTTTNHSSAVPLGIGPLSTASPLKTNGASTIGLEGLANPTAGGKWREEQSAKQAAERKAREESREALRRNLYKFLLGEPEKRPQ